MQREPTFIDSKIWGSFGGYSLLKVLDYKEDEKYSGWTGYLVTIR